MWLCLRNILTYLRVMCSWLNSSQTSINLIPDLTVLKMTYDVSPL